MQVNVNNANILASSIKGLTYFNTQLAKNCKERISQLRILLEETQREEAQSKNMLEVAKVAEQVAHAAFIAAEVALATAIATEAAAIATANPIAITAAGAAIIRATRDLEAARRVYQLALEHRKLLEKRYQMAVQCLNFSKILFEKTTITFNAQLLKITNNVSEGCYRLQNAYTDIMEYLARTQPIVYQEITTDISKLGKLDKVDKIVNIDTSKKYQPETQNKPNTTNEYSEWSNYTPTENKPIKPSEIVDRLNCNDDIKKDLLQNLYENDSNFKAMIDNYRNEYANTNDKSAVELKIRKNMAGRLGEEIVMQAFKPYGAKVSTQNRYTTEDGSYTKTDLVVENLKNPIILGKGEGNGAREGGTLAIEVKCGSAKYIKSQEEHLIFQAKGHENSDVSCIICSRDIKDMSDSSEGEFRAKMKETGSPILGMLPKKEELDKICYDFVFGG